MKARAPGKLVLSGAYSVLEGAPAIVATVDRYAIADSARLASFVTHEVQAAIDLGSISAAPWFDATALRQRDGDGEDRKLGLGSSAAIVAASIACASPIDHGGGTAVVEQVFGHALAAHRKAQPSGSGIDVAAACYGGIIRCQLGAERALTITPQSLPQPLCIEIWSSPVAASTANMLAAVNAWRADNPRRFAALIERAGSAAEAACTASQLGVLLASLRQQQRALHELGEASGAPIITTDVAVLDQLAAASDAYFGPSGAGGGDVSVYLAAQPSGDGFRREAEAASLRLVPMKVGVGGVERL